MSAIALFTEGNTTIRSSSAIRRTTTLKSCQTWLPCTSISYFRSPCIRTNENRHNGPALAVISSCLQELSTAPSIAFFDTAFHRSIPPHIAQYAIDQQVAKERGLKKYGFHGISCTSFSSPSYTLKSSLDSFILSAVSGYLKKVRRRWR